MPAYILFDILEISDPKKMEVYGRQIGSTVQRYGGRYLVRGGNVDILEGDWRPVIPVIIEFPTREQAQGWYESQEYLELRALRAEAAKLNAVFLEGA